MKDILQMNEIVELVRMVTNMYAHGWDERNGGNVSVLLDESELGQYLDLSKVIRTIPTGFEAPELEAFLQEVGTACLEHQDHGHGSRNVIRGLQVCIGICRGILPVRPQGCFSPTAGS